MNDIQKRQNCHEKQELGMELANFSMPKTVRPVNARPVNARPVNARPTDRKRKRKRKKTARTVVIFLLLIVILVCIYYLAQLIFTEHSEARRAVIAELDKNHPAWSESYLTPNEYSRPGDPIGKVKNIFVHYTANSGTNAVQNVSYFEQLKDTKERSASTHFVIGYEGDIIQCIPLNEIAYAVKTRNENSISIECCYLEEDGAFTQETYDSLIELLVWLLKRYDLEEVPTIFCRT